METLNSETTLQRNAAVLENEMTWLSAVLDTRFRLYFRQECSYNDINDLPPPRYKTGSSPYSDLVTELGLGFRERCVLLLALAPLIRPQLLDIFYTRNSTYDRGFTEFGGLKGHNHGGFLPTAETALFILAGNDLEQRIEAMKVFHPDAVLMKSGVIRVLPPPADEPPACGQLVLGQDYLGLFTTGIVEKPDYTSQFPARLISTQLDWTDLVLEDHILEEIMEIRSWLQHEKTLFQDWEMGRTLKPGYRALFFGPPGTGKTLTATLLGKSTGLDVYRIDLSMVVSKYIGETEKNLSNVFDRAQTRRWILFFDEADALFGKRTNTSSAHDRYANQEVSYLLQRIEDYPGVVILATNLKNNIDEAFARRFQSMIHFTVPGLEERIRLWKHAFPGKIKLDKDIDLPKLAEEHQLTGGAIINVVRYCSLMSLERGEMLIRKADLEKGIRKEFRKEGKTLK